MLKTSAQTFSGAQTITLWQGWDGNVQNFQHSKTASNPGTPRVNAANQVNSLTLSGSFESGDVVTTSINQVEITYVVTADDLTINGNGTGGVASDDQAKSNIAEQLTNLINANPNLVDAITANASGAEITITADTAGAPFTLETNTTNNGSDDSQASTAAVVTANATRYQLQSSGSITFTDLDLTDTSDVTRSYSSAVDSTGASSDALTTALQNIDSAFTISGAGVGSAAHSGTINWNFSIDNALTQYLAADQSIDVTYTISITDDSEVTTGDEPRTATQDVVITINGANDNPVLSVSSLQNTDTDTLTESTDGSGLTTSGNLTAADLDLNNTPSISLDRVVASGVTTGLSSNNTELRDMLILPVIPSSPPLKPSISSPGPSTQVLKTSITSPTTNGSLSPTPSNSAITSQAALMPLTTSLSISMALTTIPPSPPVMSQATSQKPAP